MESGLLGEESVKTSLWGKLDPIRGFVYAIVAMQLLCTTIISAIFMAPGLQKFVQANQWIVFLSIGASCIILFVLACFKSAAHTYPINLILLSVFTFLFSIVIGSITAYYDEGAVVMAAAATAVIVIGLTLAAWFLPCDFTGCGAFLLAFMLGLLCLGILNIFFYSQFMNTLYASLGAMLMSMYIVFDTQILMIGQKQHTLGPDDYIVGALNLYLDIINLFIYLLQLFANRDNQN